MTTPTLSPSERSYILAGLSHQSAPTRSDGRSLIASRPISISYGDAPQASGSARVIVGGTEVLAGVRLEVVDVEEGSSKWMCGVEVDVTPQAFPQLQSPALSLLSTQLTSIVADHFVPSIPPIPILPTKFFVPHLHLTVLSSLGSLPSTLILAARCALLDLSIPKTKVISTQTEAENENDLSGIKAAVRKKSLKKSNKAGAGAGSGLEWELEGGEVKMDVGDVPLLITLNLIPGSPAYFLDATPQEEAACPDRIHVWFSRDGKVRGMRMEGENGLDTGRIKPLLYEAKSVSERLFVSLDSMT